MTRRASASRAETRDRLRALVPWVIGSLLCLLALSQPAHAARTINSALLSYGAQTNLPSVTVPPGATISATVSVTHTGSTTARRWFSTSWRVGGAGAFTCVNHTQFTSSGTDSVTFSITAPGTAGTYSAEFIAWQAAGCTTNPSATFTLAKGVIVVAVADNSTVSADPATVAADGVSTSTITVTIRDAAGNPVAGKNVTLAALSGSSTISAPSGPSNASGVVTFTVRDTVVEAVTYRATNTTDKVALTQTATVNFIAPALVVSFNAVEVGANAVSGKIYTKVAGNAFAMDIVALLGGAINPKFTGAVAVEVVDNTSGGACGGLPLIAAFSNQTFTAGDKGRHRLSNNTVPNVYRNARVRIKYPAALPTVTTCSGDNFAIRPDAFTAFSVTDNDPQTPGTNRTLDNRAFTGPGALHKAARAFTVRASAVSGAGGAPVTTNYSGSPTPVLSACAGAACTAAFGALNLGASFSAGVLTSNAATYGEVGSFALQLVDSTFASVDAADGTAADRNIVSPVIDVGRFVPDHFAVTLNTPRFGTACAAGGFTYTGQRFNYVTQPVMTVTAQDANNNTTTLYTLAWWRITAASVTPVTQAMRYSAATGALDVSGLPAVAGDPAIVDAGSGTGTLTFGSGTGIAFVRGTPAVPFNADVSLALNITDADGVAYASNPARFGAASAGNGIAFDTGKELRFGRLRLQNAHGSQLISMPISMEAQYWNGTAFVTNAADSCTSFATANVALGNFQKNLAAGETTVTLGGAFNAGVGALRLSAPGAANNGSVDVSVNLTASAAGASCTTTPPMPASTGADRSYLQGAWCGPAYDRDPTARATFGVLRGSDQMIYQRENF